MPLRLDMTMMAYYDGAERTLDEYRALVAKVGMTITKEPVTITPVLSIMEARRA